MKSEVGNLLDQLGEKKPQLVLSVEDHELSIANLEKVLWRPSHTPEEVWIKREEAQQTLATDRALKRRVEWAAKQYAIAQAAMTGGA